MCVLKLADPAYSEGQRATRTKLLEAQGGNRIQNTLAQSASAGEVGVHGIAKTRGGGTTSTLPRYIEGVQSRPASA